MARKPKHNQHASFARPITAFKWGDANSVIYAWCQGGSVGHFRGQWMAEDGRALGSIEQPTLEILQYIMTDMPHHDKQMLFRHTFPSGYRLEWVPMNQVRQHKGLMEAYSRNQAAGKLAAARKAVATC